MTTTTQPHSKEHSDPDWVSMLLNECDPDEHLHTIVRDAAKLFKAPIVMINLLSAETVTFKACIGQVAGDSLDRDGSFCDVALSQDSTLNIVDASQDPQFKDFVLVTNELQIRSYFGKALHAPDGSRIGTLCVLDSKPRAYTSAESEVLSHFAEIAEAELRAILRKIPKGGTTPLLPSFA
ncbi:GAF domain-containing protein [Aeromicrobium sp.]|nr:GAF domain-containing protein [Candidatus Saccharibacteria bacterium]